MSFVVADNRRSKGIGIQARRALGIGSDQGVLPTTRPTRSDGAEGMRVAS